MLNEMLSGMRQGAPMLSFSTAISACEKNGQWLRVAQLVNDMRQSARCLASTQLLQHAKVVKSCSMWRLCSTECNRAFEYSASTQPSQH
eukprot:2834725-Karenia_brevis.AAC.1